MQETIRLHQSGDLFLFKNDSDLSRIPNIKRVKLPDNQIAWGFDTYYPQVSVTLTHLKTRFKVAATESAIETAKKIVSIPDRLTEHTLLEQFSDVLKVAPYAHQVNAILRLLYYDRLALIFEQGLGKTYIALVAHAIRQRMLGQKLKMLVLAPKIVAPNWLRETAKYTDMSILPLYGDEKGRLICRDNILNESNLDVVVTTYDVIGNSKSKQQNMKPSKSTKLEYWLGLSKAERNALVTYQELPKEEKEYLVNFPEDYTNKELTKLWASLKKIEKQLNSLDVVRKEVEGSDLTFLQNQNFDVIVFDEASRIKTHDSARTIASTQLAKDVRYRYHLSGTLCNGSPLDFYAPFSLLNNNLWKDYYAFDKEYTSRKPKPLHYVILKFRNLDSLKQKIDPYMFSAVRNDCIDLPERTFIERETPLSPELIQLYNEIVSTDEHFIKIGKEFINVCSPAVRIMKLHQLCNGFIMPSHNKEAYEVCNTCKHVEACVSNYITIYPWSKDCKCKDNHSITEKPELKPLLFNTSKIEMLEEDLESSSEKTIIWAWYQQDLKNIREVLHRMKIKFIEAGEPDCDVKFQNDPEIQVFLGQESQGIGITLTKATRTINYSFGTSLEHRLQSLDRNYRIGQKEKVLVLDYIDYNTVERWILKLLNHKVDVKEFLQKKAACVCCEMAKHCTDNNIELYSEECKYSTDLKNAERKASILLKRYPEEASSD